jgi:hypothetical protein
MNVDCEFCGKSVARTAGNQRTCLGKECRLKLRSKTRTQRYYDLRPTPICVWCEEPILEPRKRKYHTECRADKNRIRVNEYNRNRPPRQVPKRSRHYKSQVCCKYCKTKVQRTGARQFTCLGYECQLASKRDNKTRHRKRRQELARLREKKDKEFHKRGVKGSPSPRIDQPLRVAV